MQTVQTTKAGLGKFTSARVMHEKATFEYAISFIGASVLGVNQNKVSITLIDAADPAEANNILTSIEKPTCVSAELSIDTNVGTYVVNDLVNILADPTDTKFVKISIAIDTITGILEILAFEKTILEYGPPPAGKLVVTDLKEFSVPALGTSLTEIQNFIL